MTGRHAPCYCGDARTPSRTRRQSQCQQPGSQTWLAWQHLLHVVSYNCMHRQGRRHLSTTHYIHLCTGYSVSHTAHLCPYWAVYPIQHTYARIGQYIPYSTLMPVLGSVSYTAYLCSYWVVCPIKTPSIIIHTVYLPTEGA